MTDDRLPEGHSILTEPSKSEFFTGTGGKGLLISPDPRASINLVTSLVVNHHLPFPEVSAIYSNPTAPISRPSLTTSGITQL